MAAGFVYILINPSMPDMVKIGLTSDTSESRARQLSASSGVPSEFVVVYDELVTECVEVERRLHERFRAWRVNRRREFFRIPIKEAIKALQYEARDYTPRNSDSSRVNITPELREMYGHWLRPDITTVDFVQLEGVCLLETVEAPYRHFPNRIIKQVDLAVVGKGKEGRAPDDYADHYFSPADPILLNVERFLELDVVDLLNVTDLLTDDAKAAGLL
jgi:hypothetical protein